MAHLLRYDSVLGPFPGEVELGDRKISAGGETLQMLSERDPGALPWGDLGVDVCSSRPASSPTAMAPRHLDAGAKRSSSPLPQPIPTSPSCWG